jgi:kumamolisin
LLLRSVAALALTALLPHQNCPQGHFFGAQSPKKRRAFAVDLGRYESPEETYRGREGPVYVPTEVADVIEGIFGLDNRRMARRGACTAPSGAVATTPPQVAKLYNFPPCNATGQTIGIIEFGGGFAQSDLSTFCASLTPPVTAPAVIVVDQNGKPIPPTPPATPPYFGNITNPSSDDQEVALDVQVVASVAQGANIVLIFGDVAGTGGWVAAVTTAIYSSPLRLTALSISWGGSEDTWTPSIMNTLDQLFAEAAAAGITVFVSSGDLGSNSGDNDGNPHVNYPPSDPWVTACGGTFIAHPTSTPFTEGTWNDFAPAPKPPSSGGATGGGISGGGSVAATPAQTTPCFPGFGDCMRDPHRRSRLRRNQQIAPN